TCTVTATGDVSGLTAQTTFTDSPKVGSIAVGAQSPSTVTAGNSAAFVVTVGRGTSNGAFNADLSVTTPLPAGATATFSPNPLVFGSGTNTATATLTITTNVDTPESLSGTSFTVRASAGGNDRQDLAGTLTVKGAC